MRQFWMFWSQFTHGSIPTNFPSKLQCFFLPILVHLWQISASAVLGMFLRSPRSQESQFYPKILKSAVGLVAQRSSFTNMKWEAYHLLDSILGFGLHCLLANCAKFIESLLWQIYCFGNSFGTFSVPDPDHQRCHWLTQQFEIWKKGKAKQTKQFKSQENTK